MSSKATDSDLIPLDSLPGVVRGVQNGGAVPTEAAPSNSAGMLVLPALDDSDAEEWTGLSP